MSRELKPQSASNPRTQAAVELVTSGDVSLVRISGLIDERFLGFGSIGTSKTLILDVSQLTRMTSFGVRQSGSRRLQDLIYLLGCPTFCRPAQHGVELRRLQQNPYRRRAVYLSIV